MVIYEYHSFEDEEDPRRSPNRGHLFDGRWIVKEDSDYCNPDNPDESDIYDYLEWTDLFGHQDKKQLIMPSYSGFIQVLSEQLALLRDDACSSNPQQFWGLRLDWKNKEIIKGETILERSATWNEAAIVDRAGTLPNGDICFLLINDGSQRSHLHTPDKSFEVAHHCCLDAQELIIVRDNCPIPLDSDDFNCIDLCGDIISGLSTSLLEIKRYNFRTGKMVDTILVHGLPPTISCLWHKNMNDVNKTPRGAWTDSHLFLWSKEGYEYAPDDDDTDGYLHNRISSVYHVDLKTGIASPTALNLKGWIKEFIVSSDGNHLYIRVDEYLRRSSISDRHFRGYYPPIYKFRYLRVPFNRPESLFFLASVALPRPLSPLALEIINQNSKTAPIPLKIFK